LTYLYIVRTILGAGVRGLRIAGALFYNQLLMVNKAHSPSRTARAHPRISQLMAARGRRTSAISAMPVATIGARTTLASAASMIGPMPGIIRMSNDEKRINRKKTHIAAQIARQKIDAVRSEIFAIKIGYLAASFSGGPPITE
jgi:hypothetical protein